ncbi:MAG: ATP synthase F1 subunit delta [Acidobacteriota bacterium]|jgi:F-type H+-transporting ATPase subunit delta
MSLRAIARNYARALSDTLPEVDLVRRVEAELTELARAFHDTPELRTFLAGPLVPRERKRKAADELLSSAGASKETIGFVRLLIDRHRIGLMEEVAEEFSEIAQERLGVVDAEVVSAKPLSEELRTRTVRSLGRLTGREVRARFRTDPSVLGGIRTRVGDTIYDGSLRGRIDRLRERFADA